MFKIFLAIVLAIGLSIGYNSYKEHLPEDPIETLEKVASEKLDSQKIPADLKKVFRLFYIEEELKQKKSKPSWVRLEQTPLFMQQAIISVEDNRFYQHGAFDVGGILRAILVNIQSGEIVEGGSTITQQLVKNLFLSQDRTIARKLEEALYSVILEHRLSKEDILEAYLNTIYFGSNAYGIKQASLTYFSKQPEKLTPAESSLLAGLPAAPNIYSPKENPEMAKKRQAIVLETMVKNGIIGPQKAKEILAENIF